MHILTKRIVRTIAACVVWLACVGAASADDLLYATDGKQLFTIDLQTGAQTFVSDGPLQWIATPAFDEEHHTTLWIDPIGPRGEGGVQYFYGNPFTGDRGGPYPTTISFPSESGGPWVNNRAVYAPTTQRLYTVAVLNTVPQEIPFPIMVDQYNGPALPNWGRALYSQAWDYTFATALAFRSHVANDLGRSYHGERY